MLSAECRMLVLRRAAHLPHAARGVRHQAQLGPLVFFGEKVALRGGSKAALRAERQVFQRNMAGSFIYAPRQLIGILQLWALGAHQPEYNHLFFWNKTQGLECA